MTLSFDFTQEALADFDERIQQLQERLLIHCDARTSIPADLFAELRALEEMKGVPA